MVGGVADGGWDGAALSLYARFRAGEISCEDMAAELAPIWRSRSDADPLNSDAAWRAMVDHAGYFTWPSTSGPVGGRRARRPWQAQRLFRGSTRDRRFGMSWTKDPSIARWFAAYRQAPGVEDGQVWVGVFPPSRLLACLRDEQEFLVDARGVDVQLWSPESGWLTRRRRGR